MSLVIYGLHEFYRAMDLEQYTDKQIVDGILANNKVVIEYFFLKKCSALFIYILQNIFDGNIDKKELISELYLYMADQDWYKVRQFDYRSKLMTWTSVVAVRFFQKKKRELIENKSSETLNKEMDKIANVTMFIDCKMDVCNALKKMPNERYRKVIEALDLKEVHPESLAEEMKITVDNLYNIHRRALMQLKNVMGRKEEYYG